MASIPGFRTNLADGKLKILPGTSGQRVVLFGTTTNTDIPINEPISIVNPYVSVATLEHANGEPSELSLGLEDLLRTGAQNIEVVCIANTSGELDTYTANNRWDAMAASFKAVRAHQMNVVYPAGVYFDDPGLTGTDPDGNARTNFGRQLADFCYQMTNDGISCQGVIGVMPINRVARTESWSGAPTNLSGEYFALPTRDHVQEWVYHLTGSSSGEDHSSEPLTADGFLAGSVETAPGQLSGSYDFWARDEDGVIATDQFGTNVDGGAFIVVVAGLCQTSGYETKKLAAKYGSTSSVRMTNGAASFAGYLTTLAPHRGLTNKTVPGLEPVREFTRSQIESILDSRMITFMTRTNGYVVVKGTTGAHNASDYTRSDYVMISTFRTTLAAVDGVIRVCAPYIGEAINTASQSAMEGAIGNFLSDMTREGALTRSDFQLESTPDMRVLGQMTVTLTLVPAFELLEITVNTALAKE